MKISIGAYVKDGPWGGGNLFFENLKNYLKQHDHNVINHLYDEDIDVILLTDPRKNSESSSFTHEDIMKYKTKVNPNVKVLHRINECDERKNTEGLNKFLYEANKVSDATVFVSKWIEELFTNKGLNLQNPKVIMSCSNSKIFNSIGKKNWDGTEQISIVTHHWGGNWNKGFDVYEKLDQLLDDVKFRKLFKFTYIGNVPKGFTFFNSELIKPLSGEKLANELKKNHVYITGSLNEPSGNHHIEAAMCGLPILYINSGALPEYCRGYGVEFNLENLEEKIYETKLKYYEIVKNLDSYPFISDTMCQQYENLMLSIQSSESQENLKNIKRSLLKKVILKVQKIINISFYNLFRESKLWN